MRRGLRAAAWAAAFAAIAAAVALGGCARTAPHLVFLEAPLWAALDGGSLAERLAPVGQQVGRRFEVRRALSADTPLRELEELLRERSYRGVVVGPLLSLEVGQIAPMFAEVEFVALRLGDGSAGATLSSPSVRHPNLAELRFARAGGFRRAGELLALIEPAGTLGIISVQGRDESAIAAFREGYVDGGGRASFDHRRLVSTRDRGEVRRLLQDLRGTDITTVLLQAGPLTPDGLAVMRGEDMRAIVSNWGLAGAEGVRPFADVVLYSLDDDLAGGLLALYRALDGGGAPEGVAAPTVLRWGEAAPLPAAAAVYVDRTAGP